MSYKTSIRTLLVLIMLASIAKVFGMDRGPAANTLVGATRTVDISGNTLSFAMPESFSRDMPADDLVTQVDINSGEFTQNPSTGQLIRRWWDIKEPAFFGKGLGMVMMNISVHQAPENKRQSIHEQPFDISYRLDFIMAIEELLYWRHEEINEGLETTHGLPPYTYPSFSMMGDTLRSPFRDHLSNGQNWMRYGAGGPSNLLSTHYAIPIAKNTFVEVSFQYAPNQNVLPREFLDVAYQTTNPILESLHIDYAEGNPYQKLVEEEWPKETVDDVIQRHRDLIVPLFGLAPGEKVPPVEIDWSDDATLE